MNITAWKKLGSYVPVGSHRLFVMDRGDRDETIVILHGYPTSSLDFETVLPRLTEKYRVIVHDHLGFGLSDKPFDYSYSVMEQADRALAVWSQLGIEKAHLVAHDYGTTIATEIIARRNLGPGFLPIQLQSLTLSNGSVHIELAKLRFIQKLLRNKRIGPLVARLSSKRIFTKNMRELWRDPSTLTNEEIDAMWELVTVNGGKKVLPRITQYLRERELFWHRWVGALQANQLRTLFLWGKHDPITGENVARVHHAEMSGSTLRMLDDAGHYPMVEAPASWAEGLLNFLET
ncbi:MAG: alpha/beta hydrolase [Leptospirales bacterium]|jgi:pimeloyl-ACP methyl ester carboxylesterase